ncbi:hypothetical protein E5303_18535 [Vibrio cholerae O1 biovar El Tor]|uniref:hypothetical protein n=1 Tax=Vibrio cholerae TaxID=666 RepID=UPI0010A35694|nr:hypothetical protein [Vibrio cholerae]THE30067.1 hypothetical protein E5303_18535 [Vibrio cholerae O1 biovar El Tor]TQP68815.1 hypothetical protein FLL91_13370 [Vibrio cholerae]TQQ02389.1 hypothetical protein FLL72_18120 [Vibrio cholerae]
MEETDFLQELADELSALPDPSYWFSKLREIEDKLGKNKRDTVAILAKRAWLKKICNSSYPLHPDVKRDIAYKRYFLSESDNLLILATMIALIDGDNSEERYKKCKQNIEKKYGEEAWLRILRTARKINNALSNSSSNIPTSLSVMATRSVTVQGWVQDEKLSKLPKRV